MALEKSPGKNTGVSYHAHLQGIFPTQGSNLHHPHSGRDWGQEEKGTTEDEMAGWRH